MKPVWVWAGAAVIALTTSATAQTVSAILEPSQIVEIKPVVAGRIGQTVVTEGTNAARDTLLAQVDATVQNARVTVAQIAANGEAAQERANMLVQQAQTLVERITRARRKGAAQEWEVTHAQQALELAQADARLAEENTRQRAAQMKLEQATLAEFDLRAPFDGSVLQVFVEPGEIVTTDTVAFEFGALGRLDATAFVPLDWLGDLAQGDVLDAALPNQNNLRVSAQVRNIDPRIDPASQTVRVTLEVDNSDGAIFAGSVLQVSKP
jgi:RND family efflux transporter MFP subunit